jgi:penicillin G amidase
MQDTPPRPSGVRRLLRALGVVLAILVLLAAAAAGWLRWHLGRSLPALDGELAVAGLAATVTVERDAHGVPTIRGENRPDVARGLGFVHGQDRFFQMDLIRRRAAGELAELVGSAALPLDRQVRVHRFRARAHDVVEALDDDGRRLLDAYVEGVNAGLAALAAPPFEYLVLGADPVPWRREDTLLAVYAMYLDLQASDAPRESAYGLAHDLLPPALYEFLTQRGTSWDAPIDGEPFDPLPVPTPEQLEGAAPAADQEVARLGSGRPAEAFDRDFEAVDFAVGSNNWAVAGSHTADGGALLANDMHLAHAVPNIWYRASLVFPDPERPGTERRPPGGGQMRRVTGVTLPGGMMIIAGSNGEVAWGFTNSEGDWADLVVLESDPADPDAYLTPEGPRPFERHQEVLRSKDGEDETLEVLETLWGPVWDTDHAGRRRALSWVAYDPRAANLGLLRLEAAGTVEEAIAAAQRIGSPQQNFVTADSSGRIGWTIMGPVPRRFGHDGRLPTSWADGSRGWDGWLWPEEVPKIVDPPSGRIWTANARVVGGDMLALLGDGGYDLGARAHQIRDRLFALDRATEADLLAVQLDDRAIFLERWHRLLLEVLTDQAVAADPRRVELRRLLGDWDGRASPGSAAYRLVRAFRLELYDQVFGYLTAPCKAADAGFRHAYLDQEEAPLWRLASERPPHLLDPRFDDWQGQFLAAADAVIVQLTQDGAALATRTWGDRNQVAVRHPLSRFMPWAARWLDMPTLALPGDSNMPRFQAPGAGASERIVVSPGREGRGIFHMPTGQSGHPLSPHYGDGHAAWAEGQPTPFLPGPAVHTLELEPDA